MFIIGDLHANYQALESLLTIIQPRSDDTLIFLGDYLDKNPHTRKTLALLKHLSVKHRCVFLKGNHEYVWDRYVNGGELLRRDFLLKYGGVEALREFSDKPEEMLLSNNIGEIKAALVDYFSLIRETKDYEIIDRYLATHAGLSERRLSEEAPKFEEADFFLRPPDILFKKKYLGRYVIVAGHTAQASGEPLIDEGYINIDLGAGYSGGFLGALDIRNNEVVRSDGKRFNVNRR